MFAPVQAGESSPAAPSSAALTQVNAMWERGCLLQKVPQSPGVRVWVCLLSPKSQSRNMNKWHEKWLFSAVQLRKALQQSEVL